MPPYPEALPNVPSNPTLQPEDRLPHFGQSEVSPPASCIRSPAVAQFFTGATLVAPPHLPYSRFESLHALRRYSDPPIPVQSKAQKLAFPDPPRSALSGIHLQPQMPLDPFLYRSQRPFRRCLTAYVDIAVIRIPAESVPSPLQFLIERIQVEVGQQR